jgi:aryl-alcohol dehydrogenase-like predicted oxidoreductase
VSKRKSLAAYESLQPHYNLMERTGYETDLAPVVAESGVGVIPYFSLAGGFLTGKYRSEADVQGKARAGIVGKYVNARGLAVLKALDEVAAEYKSTPASVSLAWLIAQPGITAPIASATSENQLADLTAAGNLTLEKAALDRLSAASA